MKYLTVDDTLGEVAAMCTDRRNSNRSARSRTYIKGRWSIRTQVIAHARRFAVLVFSLLCRSWLPVLLLGFLLRRTRPLASVFFCYAGNERYASHYSYPSCKRVLQWFPTVIGFFKQGGAWGLICASPVTENEFRDPANLAQLRLLLRRLDSVRRIMGAHKLSLAGVLPSFLSQVGEIKEKHLSDYTAEAVCAGIFHVRQEYFDNVPHDIVLLGGAGRIGKRIREVLASAGLHSFVLDTKQRENYKLSANARPVLLVDVSWRGAIDQYIEELPTGSILLNEVFPEPSRIIIERLRARDIRVTHIGGVKAKVIPPLPFGYRGALPCCAMHSPSCSGELVLIRLA